MPGSTALAKVSTVSKWPEKCTRGEIHKPKFVSDEAWDSVHERVEQAVSSVRDLEPERIVEPYVFINAVTKVVRAAKAGDPRDRKPKRSSDPDAGWFIREVTTTATKPSLALERCTGPTKPRLPRHTLCPPGQPATAHCRHGNGQAGPRAGRSCHGCPPTSH